MKFTPENYEEILQIILSKELDKIEFTFRKRKGRVVINHVESKSHFIYFLKKKYDRTKLGDKIIVDSYFEIKTENNSMINVNSWSLVLIQFEKWLSQF